jgi:biotin carboxyl carrier protein
MPVYEVFIDGKPRKIELTKTGESSFEVKTGDKSLSIELPTDKLDLRKGFSMKIDGKAYRIELPGVYLEKVFPVKVEEVTFRAEVKIPARKLALTALEQTLVASTVKAVTPRQAVEGAITAPMTGKILSVKVKKGERVKAGQVVCVLEAMKMENEIASPKAGTIREVYVSEGSSVSEGEVLFTIG